MKASPSMPAIASQQGFTLIEVLIAIAILTIGILAAGTMQLSALRGNFQAKQLQMSVVWGSDRLEEFMGKAYDDAQLKEKKSEPEVIAGLNYTDVGVESADYHETVGQSSTVFWNVAENYPIFGCKTIRVIVRHNDQGIVKTISMDFIKLKPI
ncbi:prepilin-type N-terminal cleavage/methylation domain-containing protein [Desulfobulbus sp.]|uniref:type IV pilus modification PilV family protein n=1 Tax=Desulfobulbus sp. TaxID=895 RepID=UPI00286FA2DE|nr:prepilin-type N-terminal cleavage/methylation domain-containing protein [Desulfobulbus sp.]